MPSVRFQEYWLNCAREWEELTGLLREATGYMILNPGLYGAHWHAKRLELYPPRPGGLLGVGLNPGPYGMGQTGDSFYRHQAHPGVSAELARKPSARWAVSAGAGSGTGRAASFLKLRHEASSVRAFKFLEKAFGDAEYGLTQLVFANPCSLLFIDVDTKEGKNRTPADFRPRIRKRRRDWSDDQLRCVGGSKRASPPMCFGRGACLRCQRSDPVRAGRTTSHRRSVARPLGSGARCVLSASRSSGSGRVEWRFNGKTGRITDCSSVC